MAFKPTTYPAEKPLMYRLLKTQLTALIDGVPYLTANLANASALLNSALKEINWVGFYFLEGDIPVSYTHLDVYKRQVHTDVISKKAVTFLPYRFAFWHF